MNDMIVGFDAGTLTMSSLEIAELTGKEHKNVLADIRRMLEELGGTSADFSAVYKDQQLISRPCFNLPKRETLILVSGYNIHMRAKIIDRWQELEGRVAKPPVVRDARTAALIESLVRFDALEQEQIRMREEQEVLRSKTQEVADRLDQIETAQNHFTVVGYASVYGHGSLALTHSSRVGKAASKYCKANSVETGEVPDPRFGRVKTYPKWVLDIVFAEECEMA